MTAHPFPFTDLAEHIAWTLGRPATADELAHLCGVTRRAVVRWKHDDAVPPRNVDRIAATLNEHPALIWPRYFHAVTARGTLSVRCAA